LRAVRTVIATVASPGHLAFVHVALEICAGQIVEQHFKVGVEELGPFLLQPHKQVLLVRNDAVQTAVEPVFARHREIGCQQRIHRAFDKPMAMHAELAAWFQQPVHHQQLQHLLPTYLFAAGR